MRGQKTPQQIIDRIDQLRKIHRPSEIVKILNGIVARRTTYRILRQLRERDTEQAWESEKAIVEEKRREVRDRLEASPMPKIRRYTKTADFPPNLRNVRSA